MTSNSDREPLVIRPRLARIALDRIELHPSCLSFLDGPLPQVMDVGEGECAVVALRCSARCWCTLAIDQSYALRLTKWRR